ncbi:unnamed protein product, partial [Brassica oleracea]
VHLFEKRERELKDRWRKACDDPQRLKKTAADTTTCSFSSSVYSRCWRGRINVGTVVNSARRCHDVGGLLVSGCLSSPDSSSPPSSISGPKMKLYMSMLYFRTTEDNLRKAFELFGKLTLVNLVMDKVANRPKGFAFLRYEIEEESLKAIQGMHGKVTRSNS